MNRRLATWLAGSALLAWSCAEPAAPAAPQDPPEVAVARPLVRPIVEWDRYTGRLEAIEEVDVQARVSGYLESLHFSEGQEVERGELLAVVDPRPFEAALATARARVGEAEAGLLRARAQLEEAEAENLRRESVLTLATTRLENARRAATSNAIAREQVDVRESEFAQAEADLASAVALVASARAAIATADAEIASAEAQRDAAQLELDYTEVRAPIAGRIGDREVTRGNFVQGGTIGATRLTSIVSRGPIHVAFDANEQAFLKYVRLAEQGARESSRDVRNPIFVQLVDEQGYPHTGHIDFVDNRLDPNTGTIRGRGILPNDDELLTPGLFAVVRIPGSARYDAVMIPDAAIGSNQGERFVYVVGEDDTVAPTTIVPGPLVDGLRVVRAGLDGSERIVVRGLQRLRPGAPITPLDETIEASDDDDGLPNDYRPVPEDEWVVPAGGDDAR